MSEAMKFSPLPIPAISGASLRTATILFGSLLEMTANA